MNTPLGEIKKSHSIFQQIYAARIQFLMKPKFPQVTSDKYPSIKQTHTIVEVNYLMIVFELVVSCQLGRCGDTQVYQPEN